MAKPDDGADAVRRIAAQHGRDQYRVGRPGDRYEDPEEDAAEIVREAPLGAGGYERDPAEGDRGRDPLLPAGALDSRRPGDQADADRQRPNSSATVEALVRSTA